MTYIKRTYSLTSKFLPSLYPLSSYVFTPQTGRSHLQVYLERELKQHYTCEAILDKLTNVDFTSAQEQRYIPLYKRDFLTDALYEISGFHTNYEFITKYQMKTIQKLSKGRKNYKPLK